MSKKLRKWLRAGSPWVWFNAGAVAISIIMVAGLIGLLAFHGLRHFWPTDVMQARYQPPGLPATEVIGELIESETVLAERLQDSGVDVDPAKNFYQRDLWKFGNREITGTDFGWLLTDYISEKKFPDALTVLERQQWGNFYGIPIALLERGETLANSRAQAENDSLLWAELQFRLDRAYELREEISSLQGQELGRVNSELERLRLLERALVIADEMSPTLKQEINENRATLESRLLVIQQRLNRLKAEISRDSVLMRAVNNSEVQIALEDIVRAYQPNQLGLPGKFAVYFSRLWEFLSAEPREANTEGGVFPAIFGTVVMVLLMSIIVTPFGVIAAIYLREYAKQGLVTRLIRIAVNNLAGVPSIVYGVFGLGFFIYFIGGEIDQLFYAEALPAPTFGTPGLLWASLTLALLTVPVVIVATEEGLTRIPRSIREGSLALGATKFETIWRVVLPMASPGMMTGLILAIARAAGEVAPLMLVGVVKLAPSLPVNGIYPYVHLDQQFMHLGFHIYDVGFQSPNVEAARPLVFATALLLVIVIAVLNLTAAALRNRLRENYQALDV